MEKILNVMTTITPRASGYLPYIIKQNPYIFYYYCIGYHNGKLVRDVQLFTAICYFKTVRWRNSFEKICKLHLCFRFPDFYLWKIFSN